VKSSQEPLKLELLKKIEFNSDRKRMSILVRDPTDGLIKLYIKGADSIILDRLSREPEKNDEDTMSYVKKFVDYSSCIGLRTLLVAVKVLDEDELLQFNQDVEKADSNIENRDANMAKVFDLFERDLTLIGATAVEDRL
jgi:phospholipid-transporting ATPase